MHSGTGANGSFFVLHPKASKAESQILRMRKAPYLVGAASIAATILAVNHASAHPEFNAISTNRYVKLDLTGPDEIRLAYTVMFGSGPAQAARKVADANADGKLDAGEQKALGVKVERDVSRGLQLELDGKPAPLVFDPPQVGLMGDDVGPNPFSVDLIAHLSAPAAAEHRVLLDDKTEFELLGETEIRVEDSPTARLVDGPPRTLFRGARQSTLEDRTVRFRFAATPGARPVAKKRAPWPWAVAALLLVCVLMTLGLRRYRSMKGY
jgi:hypothetical protein